MKCVDINNQKNYVINPHLSYESEMKMVFHLLLFRIIDKYHLNRNYILERSIKILLRKFCMYARCSGCRKPSLGIYTSFRIIIGRRCPGSILANFRLYETCMYVSDGDWRERKLYVNIETGNGDVRMCAALSD